MALRSHLSGLHLRDALPVQEYRVRVELSVDGTGRDVQVRTFLPVSDERQAVRDHVLTGDLTYAQEARDGNLVATWQGEDVSGHHELSADWTARCEHVRWEIPAELPPPRPEGLPPELARELEPTEVVQSEDPEVIALARRLAPAGTPLPRVLDALFDHVAAMPYVEFKGTTDALTALRLGEASCNGKGRLLVALLRASGVPARLVGGVILQPGSKRTSHQWIEAWVANRWVPYCPTNGYRAELPETYLALYRGDHALFKRTSDIGFDYSFRISRRLLPPAPSARVTSVLGRWDPRVALASVGLEPDLLRVVLMIPVGVLVLVLCRNVVGLSTFGTFLPALIAAAGRGTGLTWCLGGFVLVVLATLAVSQVLERLSLLHVPKMGILITFVVILLLAATAVGAAAGMPNLAGVGLFPMALLALTAERAGRMLEDSGARKLASLMVSTLVAIVACWIVMESVAVQSVVMAFPELLLLIVAVEIWLGGWTGLRVSELRRFRSLLAEERAS